CPKARILVIGGIFLGQGPAVIDHDLTAVAWDAWHLDELESAARARGIHSLPVHLELDTGMSRQGASLSPAGDANESALDTLLARFTANSPLRLDGVMTHLYAAD